jgi:diadenosine tetraphosphate (Ap4A) HIT family hydrolase
MSPAIDTQAQSGCPLCRPPESTALGVPGTARLVYEAPRFRLIHAGEEQARGFPAFYRIVWREHVREFSDLSAPERALCTEALAAAERALRATLAPVKINLATLGNQVPHLHWHLIARFDWDSHFPAPVWAAPLRARDPAREAALIARLPQTERALVQALSEVVSAFEAPPPFKGLEDLERPGKSAPPERQKARR